MVTDAFINKIVEFKIGKNGIFSSYGIGEIYEITNNGEYVVEVMVPIPERGEIVKIKRSDIIRILNKDTLKKINAYEENYARHEAGEGKPGTWNDGYNYKDYMRKKVVKKPKPKRKVCSCRKK